MVTGNLQIKDGKYYAVVNLRDETGKRKQKWVSTGLPVRGNKKNAEQFLNQELEKWNYHNGVYYGISVAEYFEIWLTEIEKEVRPNTFRSYKGNMTNHIIPYFRNTKIQLQSIKPIDLEYLRGFTDGIDGYFDDYNYCHYCGKKLEVKNFQLKFYKIYDKIYYTKKIKEK